MVGMSSQAWDAVASLSDSESVRMHLRRHFRRVACSSPKIWKQKPCTANYAVQDERRRVAANCENASILTRMCNCMPGEPQSGRQGGMGCERPGKLYTVRQKAPPSPHPFPEGFTCLIDWGARRILEHLRVAQSIHRVVLPWSISLIAQSSPDLPKHQQAWLA